MLIYVIKFLGVVSQKQIWNIFISHFWKKTYHRSVLVDVGFLKSIWYQTKHSDIACYREQ